MFEFAIIDSLGAESAFLCCGIPILCIQIIFFSVYLYIAHVFYQISFFMGTEIADCSCWTKRSKGIHKFTAYTVERDTHLQITPFFNTTEWHWNNGDIYLDITGEILVGGVLSVFIFHTDLFIPFILQCKLSNIIWQFHAIVFFVLVRSKQNILLKKDYQKLYFTHGFIILNQVFKFLLLSIGYEIQCNS